MGTTVWHVLNGVVFVAWVICIASWVKRGCRIPRWVHVFAGCLLAAGIVVLIVLGLNRILTVRLALSCVLVPPAAAYMGWLWMFGPSLSGEGDSLPTPEDHPHVVGAPDQPGVGPGSTTAEPGDWEAGESKPTQNRD